jgi:hypothetical protein
MVGTNGGGGKNGGWGSGRSTGFGSGGGFNSGWDRGQPKASNPDDKIGDFIRIENHPFVLHRDLKDKKCKARLTNGMACHFGDNCNLDHTKFDDWKGYDKTLQLDFV